MTILDLFDEYGNGMGFPSMKDFFESSPYDGLEKIAAYLDGGTVKIASTGASYDFFTGEKIPIVETIKTDGTYIWNSSLPYYVRKYNLRLDKGFENMVLGIQGAAT